MPNFDKFAKLDEYQNIVYPPHNDGNIMNCHLNLQWLTEHGFEQHTDEWFQEHTPKPTPIIDPEIYYSKYKIKQELDKLNKWNDFKTILQQNDKYEDFMLAQVLSNKDQNFIAIKDVIVNALGIQNADQLLELCRS